MQLIKSFKFERRNKIAIVSCIIIIIIIVAVFIIVITPINYSADTKGEINKVLWEAGRLKNILYSKYIKDLDPDNNNINIKLYLPENLVLDSGETINWVIDPRFGILVETDRAVDGYYVFIDSERKIGMRLEKK